MKGGKGPTGRAILSYPDPHRSSFLDYLFIYLISLDGYINLYQVSFGVRVEPIPHRPQSVLITSVVGPTTLD